MTRATIEVHHEFSEVFPNGGAQDTSLPKSVFVGGKTLPYTPPEEKSRGLLFIGTRRESPQTKNDLSPTLSCKTNPFIAGTRSWGQNYLELV